MKRIVCDTNVILSGLLWNGAPRQVLTRIEQGKHSLFTSRPLLEELDRVLGYAKFRSVFGKAGLDRQDVLRWIVRHATLIMVKPLDRTVVRADPSDDWVLVCAVSASADAVVSVDKHLLRIRSFRGIPILTADRFLKESK